MVREIERLWEKTEKELKLKEDKIKEEEKKKESIGKTQSDPVKIDKL